ncbi:PAS domain-containing sensor histidine kinase [Lewinella cohaerens]|uniref:PAS domain-containing sensor histidine kinase n=1 Tax=Lewinella cohaerens TaxID=70995 RepID=UPI0003A62D9E|nr:ATP-binding protein [Lewinella cohaerens]
MFSSISIDWFTLLSGFAILVMGLRVYWLDTHRRMYQTFMATTLLLFIQNLFFFEMESVTDLEKALNLRRWQENIWNLTVVCMLLTMWFYAKQFAPREMKKWEYSSLIFAFLIVLGFVYLEGFTLHGHGDLFFNENGRLALTMDSYTGYDFFRFGGVVVTYGLCIYFSYLPYHYAFNSSTRGIRMGIVIIFSLVMIGSFVQNYLLTYFLGIPSLLNESINVAIGGLFTGLMIVNLQLTDLQSQHAVPSLLKTMTNWFILTDKDFRIKQVNSAFLELMGGSAKNWQDKYLNEVFTGKEWEKTRERLLALEQNERGNYETNISVGGQNNYLLFLVTPIYKKFFGLGGNLRRGYVFVGTDLTDYKTSEARILAYAQDLETSNQALERFAFIASHDLKEPIRNIGSFAGLLRRRLAPPSGSEVEEYLEFIERNVQGMNRLIEAVMTVSRLGQEGLSFEPVNLVGITKEISKRLWNENDGKQLQITFDGDALLKGDEELLQQLIQNLLENALKYNEAEQPCLIIRVEADSLPGFVKLYFEDNGIGVSEAYREHVFEMFKRLHSRAAYSGTGIGLAICRRIVELHGGEIWIEDTTNGVGSAFVMRLPSSK